MLLWEQERKLILAFGYMYVAYFGLALFSMDIQSFKILLNLYELGVHLFTLQALSLFAG